VHNREDGMDCCDHGHAFTRRQWMWTAVTSVAAMLGGGVAPRGSTAAAQIADTACPPGWADL